METTLILYEICEYFVLYNRAEVKITDCVKSFKSLFNFSQTQGFSIILIMFNFKAFFFFSLECSTLRFQSTCMRVLEMLSQILTDFFFALSNQTKFKIKHEENEETLIFNFLLFKLIMQLNVSTKKYSALNNLELRHMDVIYKNSSEI